MIGKKRILVVDDDQDIVELISMMLEYSGYDINTAVSGDECLEILKKEKPDLIILDIMLETITKGFNVGYEIKNNPDYWSIPIILVSAIDKHSGFPVDTDFIKADKFLEKPIEPDELLESILELLKEV